MIVDSRLSDVRSFNDTEDNAPYLHIWRQMVISTFEMDFDVNIMLNDTIPNSQLDLTWIGIIGPQPIILW